jgi:amino acid transporter
VLLVDIGLIIADFASENHERVHNGVTYFNGLMWVFIISCVVASVFMFIEVAKSYFAPEDMPQIKKKAFMIAALVVYTAVIAFSMFFIFKVVHGNDERYGIFRSVLYFFYYVLDDLVPLNILLIYVYKIKGYSESTLEDIASEIIRQQSDGLISLTSHKA